MSDDWRNTQDREERIKLIAGGGLAIVVILIIGLVIYQSLDHGKRTAATSSTETTETADTTPGRGIATTTPLPTTTTTQAPLQQTDPQGDVFTPDQLQALYNQNNSRLDPVEYANAVKLGSDFARVDATGEGTQTFAGYYKENPVHPWVKNFHQQYVTAMATPDDTLVKVLVWFDGTEISTGNTIAQAKQGFYLRRIQQGGLAPVYTMPGSTDDRDIDVDIIYQ